MLLPTYKFGLGSHSRLLIMKKVQSLFAINSKTLHFHFLFRPRSALYNTPYNPYARPLALDTFRTPPPELEAEIDLGVVAASRDVFLLGDALLAAILLAIALPTPILP